MANIEMNYYNGSTYEVLYPYVNLSNSIGSLDINSRTSGNLNISSRTTGTLPLSRGGTGGTSATSGLYNLINGSSTLTTLATGDYIPLQDVSASNAKKITVNNLISYLESNLDIGESSSISITQGTYYGTGSNQTVTVNTTIQPKVFFYI